jgi:hypothetical protein
VLIESTNRRIATRLDSSSGPSLRASSRSSPMPAHARVLPRNPDVDLRQITTFGSRLMSGATRALAGRAPWYVGLTTVGTVLKRLSAASPRRTGDGGKRPGTRTRINGAKIS